MTEITIASIYPLTVGISRPRRIPESEFWIPGVPENDEDAVRDRLLHPKTIVIRDTEEVWFAPITHTRQGQLITASETANDFIQHATTQSPGMGVACHPGVWICAGSSPTAAEIAYWKHIQTPYLNYSFDQANAWATDPQNKGAIVWRNRMAAIALGRKPEWLRPPTGDDVKECQYCTKSVPSHTVVCPHCSQVINVARYAELKEQEKNALRKTAA